MTWWRGRDAAQQLRRDAHLSEDAPVDIFALLREQSVLVWVRDLGWNDEGRYVRRGGRALAVINGSEEQLPGRQRFTAAHELGHHVLLGTDIPDAAFVDMTTSSANDPDEKAANGFAAEILLPKLGLERALGAAGVGAEQLTPNQLGEVMIEFGVSAMTLIYRIHNTGLTTPAGRDALMALRWAATEYANATRGGFWSLEPVGVPSSHAMNVQALLDQGRIVEDRARQLLRA